MHYFHIFSYDLNISITFFGSGPRSGPLKSYFGHIPGHRGTDLSGGVDLLKSGFVRSTTGIDAEDGTGEGSTLRAELRLGTDQNQKASGGVGGPNPRGRPQRLAVGSSSSVDVPCGCG